ncbi:MAG: DEAD/DEAH box helicase, partial [Patescibacteria group bacterium]
MKDCKHLITLFPHGQNLGVLEQFTEQGYTSLSGGGNFSSKAFVVADVLRDSKDLHNVIWICSDHSQKEHVARSLMLWGDTFVHDFEIEENPLKEKATDRRNRVRVMELISLASDSSRATYFTIEYKDLFRLYPSRVDVENGIIELKKGDDVDPVPFFEKLILAGYDVAQDFFVEKGQYYRQGDTLLIWPVNSDFPVRMEVGFDRLDKISIFDQREKKDIQEIETVKIYPLQIEHWDTPLLNYFGRGSLVIDDEVEYPEMHAEQFAAAMKQRDAGSRYVEFRSFMEETPYHHHLHYLSILKYHTAADFISDARDKLSQDWKVVVFTKHPENYEGLLKDKKMSYEKWERGMRMGGKGVTLIEIDKDEVFPQNFQNSSLRLAVLSDRDVGGLGEETKKAPERQKAYLDFLTGLKMGDYVVHSDHGIGLFLGLDKRTIDEVTREYLKIGYAENDKLFVPIDQADKVSKYIGSGDKPPKLTRLGSAEWNTIQSRVRKETEKIAKELLELYAERERARGFQFKEDTSVTLEFEKKFPYEETPGQLRAIYEVRKDMEQKKPMDRLVCGDVGFGKTEVAMRAAFKAVQDKKQVAVLAPITILVDQHYKNFVKRMEDFNVRIEMLSRFRSPAEQKKILEKLKRGEIDIIIGTHRLLQDDIHFKDLGLVVIDEEQRFGVKQKERLKEMRTEVHILTMTATTI